MPDTFWPDLLVALIATTFGAILTVGIAFATYRHEIRSRERNAIRHLANILASRRALIAANPSRVDTTVRSHSDDLEACRKSITQAREAIIEASRAVQPGLEAQESLDKMARATNRFLNASNRDPNGYWIQLNDLRTDLISALAELATQTNQRLPEPGSRGQV